MQEPLSRLLAPSRWISRTRKFLEHHLLQLESQLEEEGREELVGREKETKIKRI